jgi:hypothetical protein
VALEAQRGRAPARSELDRFVVEGAERDDVPHISVAAERSLGVPARRPVR